MAAAFFFGILSLAFGPGAAVWCLLIARKSFLLLLSLFSAFYWLSVLLVISGIFRGFLPVAATTESYAGARRLLYHAAPGAPVPPRAAGPPPRPLTYFVWRSRKSFTKAANRPSEIARRMASVRAWKKAMLCQDSRTWLRISSDFTR